LKGSKCLNPRLVPHLLAALVIPARAGFAHTVDRLPGGVGIVKAQLAELLTAEGSLGIAGL
jgi:hypothetical protein